MSSAFDLLNKDGGNLCIWSQKVDILKDIASRGRSGGHF